MSQTQRDNAPLSRTTGKTKVVREMLEFMAMEVLEIYNYFTRIVLLLYLL